VKMWLIVIINNRSNLLQLDRQKLSQQKCWRSADRISRGFHFKNMSSVRNGGSW